MGDREGCTRTEGGRNEGRRGGEIKTEHSWKTLGETDHSHIVLYLQIKGPGCIRFSIFWESI